MQSLRHIVVGVDFSPCAELALDCAITLASASLAKITLVHVCELSAVVDGAGLSPSEWDDAQLRFARERLAAQVASRERCGVEVQGLLRTGKPWEKLANAATEVGASLIAIGRTGCGGATILGRVADQLLRTASRPVLAVPVPRDVTGRAP